MVYSLAVRKDLSDRRKADYAKTIDAMSLQDLVKEFFTYLDYVEETSSGREFHPITIGSCRILMSEPLDMCMKKLREAVSD